MEKSLPAWWRRGPCGQKLPSHVLPGQAGGKNIGENLLSAAQTVDRGCDSDPAGTEPEFCLSGLTQT